jgi:protein-S-isoprenylcysteine O-methyltransferase Ste14
MIKFGASFGFAVMGRISLLIGRFEELIKFSKPEYYYSTPIILISIIIVLGYWAFKENNNIKNESILEE